MGSAVAAENCFLDEIYGDLNDDEFSNIDSSLVVSLLEDVQAEDDGNDEMLRGMIQSLQPEIMNQDSCSETDNSDVSSEDYRFSDESCSSSPHHHQDFEWLDMEMEMAYSCSGYDTNGYFTGHFAGDMVEVGGLEEDYSQVCYGMAMEEDHYIDLWQ